MSQSPPLLYPHSHPNITYHNTSQQRSPTPQHNTPTNNPSHANQGSRQQHHKQQAHTPCYYHRLYRTHARKCTSPCTYNRGNWVVARRLWDSSRLSSEHLNPMKPQYYLFRTQSVLFTSPLTLVQTLAFLSESTLITILVNKWVTVWNK